MENQTTEWKESWHDKYMRTICAFANASGGVLEIGRRDNGEIAGVDDVQKLLEDLPNKIKSAMAIIPDIRVCESDGKLPENWTVDNLFAPHTSKPYNPLIADAFFRSGQIEAWGRGVEKISEARRYWGQSEPFYKISSNEVMIGFNAEVGIARNQEEVDSEVGNGVGNRVGNKVGNNIENELSENQLKIMDNIANNPRVTTLELASIIGISKRKMETNISKLKDYGLIERIGTKGGRWVVKIQVS